MMRLRSLLELLSVNSINAVLEILGDGFRFQPTDEELINFLKYKIGGFESKVEMIPVVDVNKFEPWDLPDVISGRSCLNSKQKEWFCFSSPDYKYKNSNRCNRLTVAGYWKPTGKVRSIKISGTNNVIGRKKTLVFYIGRVPGGIRTDWIIHEYHRKVRHSDQSDFVICRLMKQEEKKLQGTHESNVNEENTDGSLTCDTANETTQNKILEAHVMTQDNEDAFCDFPYQQGDSYPSFIVQSSEHNELGISLSDLCFDNESPGYEELGLSVTDLIGNEGTSVETGACTDNCEDDLTDFVNSLFVGKDDKLNDDIANVLFNDSIPRGPLMFSEAVLNSNEGWEVPVEIYSPNTDGGYISPKT